MLDETANVDGSLGEGGFNGSGKVTSELWGQILSLLPGGTHPLKHLDLPATTLNKDTCMVVLWGGGRIASALLPIPSQNSMHMLKILLNYITESTWAVGEKWEEQRVVACPAAVDRCSPCSWGDSQQSVQGKGSWPRRAPSSQLFESRRWGKRSTS